MIHRRQDDGLSRPRPSVPDRAAALLILPLTMVLVLLVGVFFVFGSPFAVNGTSMYPTLHHTDRLLITRSYRTPQRGDIVVFDRLEDGVPTDLVKRVIGIPGDEVRLVGDHAWVNGRPEGGHPVRTSPSQDYAPVEVTVRPGHVFVLGDNRPVSNDSRFIGQVPLSAVKGKAVWIFTPITRIRRLP